MTDDTSAAVEAPQGAPAAAQPQVHAPAVLPAADALESLPQWFDKVAADWSAALGKRASVAAAPVVAPDAAALAALPARLPVAVSATAKCGEVSVPVMALADDASALAIARAALGDKAPQTLDDAALSAFGELVKQAFGSLEGEWIAGGASGLAIDAGSPQRITEIGGDIAGGSPVLSEISLSIDGGDPIALTFLFGERIGGLFAAVAAPAAAPVAAAAPPVNVNRILRVTVPLVVEIARRPITLKDVIAFKPGTVIEFDKKSDDLLDLVVGLTRVGKGEAVKVGESFGLRILEVGSIRDRIKSLAQ
jgi:flagellar motor switch protein FliN/FliY